MLGKILQLIWFIILIGSFFPTFEEQSKLVTEWKDFSLWVRQILKYLNEKILNYSNLHINRKSKKVTLVEYLSITILGLIVSWGIGALIYYFFQPYFGVYTWILIWFFSLLTWYIIAYLLIFLLLIFNFIIIGFLFFINILLKAMGVFTKLYNMSYLVRFFWVIITLIWIVI